MNVREQVLELVCESTGAEMDEITDQSTLESLGADSLDAVELAIDLELTFDGPEFSDEEIQLTTTIGQLVELVEKRANGKSH